VAGICNSVGGGVFLTCHCGGGDGGEYRSVSRLGLLIGNSSPALRSRRDQMTQQKWAAVFRKQRVGRPPRTLQNTAMAVFVQW